MATPKAPKTPKKAPSSVHPNQTNSESKVRVVLRIRPFLDSEIAALAGNRTPCVSVLDGECGSSQEVTVHIKDQESSRNECYKLDSFFGQGNDNVGQIFQKEVSHVIPGIFSGCNATIFAYGATGSGKTYTMQGSDEQPGLMPLAISNILSMCESSTGSSVWISYYEVYMDRCYDLLEPKAKEISALEDKDGRVQLRGLSQVPVRSMTEFHEIFASGVQRRKVAHTGLNDVSSRSHGILMISVSSSYGDGSHTVAGKLNLIDLAGNEDNRRSGNEGIRMQESAKINQSLFALSNVIYALNNNESRIPYRESKLTRILQDSLGGSSRALMIACLVRVGDGFPYPENPISYQEAVHTVSLAARSRQVINYISSNKHETPKVKVDMEAKLRAWLESKGKTKSAQRIGALNSPLVRRTPTPVSSLKKSNSIRSSVKVPTNQRVSHAKTRRLFDSQSFAAVTTEESSSSASANGDTSAVNKEAFIHSLEEDCKENSGTMEEDGASDLSKSNICDQMIGCHESDIQEEKKAKGNICDLKPPNCEYLNTEIMPTDFVESPPIRENLSRKSPSPVGSNIIETHSGDTLNKDNMLEDIPRSPPIEERVKALKNYLRKVLSPIDSNGNMTPNKDLLSDDQICVVLFGPKTPKTPYILKCDSDGIQMNGTPLDKFNMHSSNLKSALVHDYLAFLNTASR
ncbi:hypothetical protein ACLOJK_012854 [Asimina triloba]